MDGWLQRLIEERDRVENRFVNLQMFLDADLPYTEEELHPQDVSYMYEQLKAMEDYLLFMNARIGRNTKND